MPPARPLTIDVHSHAIPPGFVDAARKDTAMDGIRVEHDNGREWMIHRQGMRYPLSPALYDIEARLAAMDRMGIDAAVVSLAPTWFCYWADPGEAVDFCRQANEGLAAFAQESGGRLTTVATLPMQEPAAAVRELERAITDLGMRGVQIAPIVEGRPLDDPELAPVLHTAARLEVPVILHPYPGAPRLDNLNDFYLTNLIGHPLDTCISSARLILTGVLDEFPALELVLMHGGGFLPYQIGRLDHGYRVRPETRISCTAPPSHYLRRFTFDTITHAPVPLRFLVNVVGADRVAYGTDFDFDMASGPLPDQLTGANLKADEIEQIAAGSALRLFPAAFRNIEEGRPADPVSQKSRQQR